MPFSATEASRHGFFCPPACCLSHRGQPPGVRCAHFGGSLLNTRFFRVSFADYEGLPPQYPFFRKIRFLTIITYAFAERLIRKAHADRADAGPHSVQRWEARVVVPALTCPPNRMVGCMVQGVEAEE